MRKAIIFGAALALAASAVSSDLPAGAAQRRGRARRPSVLCPDPTVRCRTSYKFEPHQMPFAIPAGGVLEESEPFYAVILKSVRDAAQDCSVFVPEAERLEAQRLFPRHKVFASRCADPGELYYTGVAENQQFMAVYAGHTRAEAERMLAKVRATGQYAGANLRRMRTNFNGT